MDEEKPSPKRGVVVMEDVAYQMGYDDYDFNRSYRSWDDKPVANSLEARLFTVWADAYNRGFIDAMDGKPRKLFISQHQKRQLISILKIRKTFENIRNLFVFKKKPGKYSIPSRDEPDRP